MQELYAEWVGVQAKVALLEGNAICIAHLQASPDASSLDIVSRAQSKHEGQDRPYVSLWKHLIMYVYVCFKASICTIISQPSEPIPITVLPSPVTSILRKYIIGFYADCMPCKSHTFGDIDLDIPSCKPSSAEATFCIQDLDEHVGGARTGLAGPINPVSACPGCVQPPPL